MCVCPKIQVLLRAGEVTKLAVTVAVTSLKPADKLFCKPKILHLANILDPIFEQYYLCINPIPTGHGRNQPIYERHVTKSGRNRVKNIFQESLADF